MDWFLNSIVMEVKRNLGSSDHAFPEQYKDYSPQNLEEEDHRRMPGGFDARRKIRRDGTFGRKKGKESKRKKDGQNPHGLIRRYTPVAAIVSPQCFR